MGLGLAVLPLLLLTSVTARGWIGVDGAVDRSDVGDVVVGDVAATEVAGVTGFIRSPLMTAGGGRGLSVRVAGAGAAGSTFSRCACRYALLFEGVMGKAGVRAGLDLAGESARWVGGEKTAGLRRTSSAFAVGEGAWRGSLRLSLLFSVSLRLSLGMSGAVGDAYLTAGRVAGAREKRRPICTVALLSVLTCRLLPMAKNGLGLSMDSNSRLTSVTELRRLKRRIASFDILDSPLAALAGL